VASLLRRGLRRLQRPARDFFGAALGNVVRGVPLDSTGYFFLPLWTNFQPGPNPGILDCVHRPGGPAGVRHTDPAWRPLAGLQDEDILEQRAQKVARMAWYGVAALTAVVTVATMIVQPQVLANLRAHPWGYVFPALALAGLVGIRLGGEAKPFLASCAYIVGMLTSAAFGVFPYVLPRTPIRPWA